MGTDSGRSLCGRVGSCALGSGVSQEHQLKGATESELLEGRRGHEDLAAGDCVPFCTCEPSVTLSAKFGDRKTFVL